MKKYHINNLIIYDKFFTSNGKVTIDMKYDNIKQHTTYKYKFSDKVN